MKLRKNHYYVLNLNGKNQVQLFKGESRLGFMFVTDNSGSAIFLGANRVTEAEPKIIEKKVAQKFLGIK